VAFRAAKACIGFCYGQVESRAARTSLRISTHLSRVDFLLCQVLSRNGQESETFDLSPKRCAAHRLGTGQIFPGLDPVNLISSNRESFLSTRLSSRSGQNWQTFDLSPSVAFVPKRCVALSSCPQSVRMSPKRAQKRCAVP
jgi:hypothetical protein